MTLVGELVLARNRLLPFAADHAETAYVAATQRLDTITTELQERVMKTRMQPISAIWSKFPRLVRDLAQACGKQVNLVLEGQGTELDRTLLEAVKDPLTHLIRNSVDHGIEPPAARVAAGKPPAGRLLLRACHEAGLVIIEITDDGRGIDLARVREKAVERGLMSAALELTRHRELTRVPLAPPTVAGLMNLRGQLVTVLDLRRRLDLPPGPADARPMHVVLNTPDGPLSLLVDEVGEITELSEADFEPPPESVRGVARELILGVCQLPGSLLLILDSTKVANLPPPAAAPRPHPTPAHP